MFVVEQNEFVDSALDISDEFLFGVEIMLQLLGEFKVSEKLRKLLELSEFSKLLEVAGLPKVLELSKYILKSLEFFVFLIDHNSGIKRDTFELLFSINTSKYTSRYQNKKTVERICF